MNIRKGQKINVSEGNSTAPRTAEFSGLYTIDAVSFNEEGEVEFSGTHDETGFRMGFLLDNLLTTPPDENSH